MIDPVAGSGATLRAAAELKRNSYGFEIVKEFYRQAQEQMLDIPEDKQYSMELEVTG